MEEFYVVQFMYENGANEVFIQDYDSASILFRSIYLSDRGVFSKMLKSYEGKPIVFDDRPSDERSDYRNGKIIRWEATDGFIKRLEKFVD